MDIFLDKVANYLHQNFKDNFHKYWLVFPNKRTGLFFKNYLIKQSSQPLFIPQIFSIDEFIARFSSLQEIDDLGAIFELYKIHNRITGSEDSFDDFYFWGEMILSDFDDIDKYLTDAKKLYTNLLNLKEIDQFFLEDDIVDTNAIKSFWNELVASKKDGAKEFLKTWESLYPIYEAFRESLLEKQLGTKGMLYRNAAENIATLDLTSMPFLRVGLVGFNALTRAEEQIFKALNKAGNVDFFWDYASEMLEKEDTNSGFFLKKYTKIFPGVFTAPLSPSNNINISLKAVPSSSAQTAVAKNILSNIHEPGLNTALVLADEELLMNMQQSLPASIRDVNITMGYPLKSSQVSSLLNNIIKLQQRFRLQKGEVSYHHALITPLLSNSVIQRATGSAKEYIHKITNENLFYVGRSFFKNDPILYQIFETVEQGSEVTPYLLKLFSELLISFNSSTDETDQSADIEKELVYAAFIKLQRISSLFTDNDAMPGRDLMFKIIKRIIDNISIPFEGEPLKGLQIMGVLETRNLEFENVIVLSANEGYLPTSSQGKSFIPFNLRKGYGLPTVQEQDAMYAYYFYRLVYRAKNVHLLYNSSASGLNSGEPSRYLYQLKYLSDFNIKESSISYQINAGRLQEITIEKDAKVQEKLNRYFKGENKISASGLNTFLDCKLKFYFTYVEQIRKPDEISDELEDRVFGNIFHDVMENIYKGYENSEISAELLENVIKDKKTIENTVKAQFFKHFFKKSKPGTEDFDLIKGKLIIYLNVLIKYVIKLLQFDKKHAPFYYKKGEEFVEKTFLLNNSRELTCMAKIDRIDEKDGQTRILDYKSGSIKTNTSNKIVLKDIEALFLREKPLDADQKAIFQTLYYSWLYAQAEQNHTALQPAIIPIRNLFGAYVLNSLIQYEGKNLVYESVKESFEEQLSATINEIFDLEHAFTQTEHLKNCEYCDFKNICKR